MTAICGKEFARLLESHGWSLQRTNGSHHIYSKAGSTVRISIPIHGNLSLKVGLPRHLLKLAGLQPQFRLRQLISALLILAVTYRRIDSLK